MRSGARAPRQDMMTLAELNGKDREAFAGAIGWAFEGSPWVAERAWSKRPFATIDALHDAMSSAVAAASRDEQLALLRAHPDLGTVRLKPDTTEGSVGLQADQMSEASRREQAGAGFDALARDELDRLRALNAAYREKFGFPFLYAVKGSTTHDILNAIERRLTSMRDAEEQEALRQVYRIARFRLEETVRQELP
jgi:2-oxo-4-hydroxy-4-carboxy-5-ureidoimidazoline decarboxylase